MDDKSMASQAGTSNQPATEAQEMVAGSTSYSGGSAMLDAQVQASELQQDNPVGAKPIATNNADNSDQDDPANAKLFTTTGNYPPDFGRLEDQGNMSIANDNPSAE